MHVTKSITVNRSSEEVYQFWRDFQKLPTFMSHLESVDVDANGISHWRARGPAGMTVEWDAQVTEDQPNRLIAWQSLAGSDVTHVGSVHFALAPGGRGTEVRVEVDYEMPAGKIGQIAAKLFGEDPAHQLHDDLHAFKQVMETGEVVISDATTLQGRMRKHPGRPPTDEELEELRGEMKNKGYNG